MNDKHSATDLVPVLVYAQGLTDADKTSGSKENLE